MAHWHRIITCESSRPQLVLWAHGKETWSRTPLAPIEKLPRLVKLDPAFPWDRTNPNRIRMMQTHYSGHGAPHAEMMQRVAETLGWPALEATMR